MSDIWEFAKAMEKEGQAYYLSLAKKTTVRELAGVFNDMAREEEKHYQLFDSLQKKSTGVKPVTSTMLVNAKAAFKKIAAGVEQKETLDNAASLYEKALEMERNAVTTYQDALTKSADPGAGPVLGAIIAEEKSHVKIVESIIDYLRDPKHWIADAEFSTLGE